jgi:hypothetical protein
MVSVSSSYLVAVYMYRWDIRYCLFGIHVDKDWNIVWPDMVVVLKQKCLWIIFGISIFILHKYQKLLPYVIEEPDAVIACRWANRFKYIAANELCFFIVWRWKDDIIVCRSLNTVLVYCMFRWKNISAIMLY